MAAMLLLSLTPFLGASAGISVWEHWRAAFCGTVGGRFTNQMSILSEPEFCGGHVSFAYSLLSPYRLKEGFRLPLLRKHEEFMTSGKTKEAATVMFQMCAVERTDTALSVPPRHLWPWREVLQTAFPELRPS